MNKHGQVKQPVQLQSTGATGSFHFPREFCTDNTFPFCYEVAAAPENAIAPLTVTLQTPFLTPPTTLGDVDEQCWIPGAGNCRNCSTLPLVALFLVPFLPLFWSAACHHRRNKREAERWDWRFLSQLENNIISVSLLHSSKVSLLTPFLQGCKKLSICEVSLISLSLNQQICQHLFLRRGRAMFPCK